MSNAIETDGLTKNFGGLTALEGLDLVVPEGELFGFIGPNGAGKSTTIKILTGQMRPTSGSSRVLGIDPVEDSIGVRSEIGVLPESENPPSFLTPREYFDFVAGIRGIESHEEEVEEWADRLRFKDKLDTINMDLSRGQKQKVMVTQAFLHRPDLVFIDEPLTNLDPIIQESLKDYILEYHDNGNTLFLSTHHISVAEELCTRVGIIDEGRMIAERDVEEIRTAGTKLIDEFLKEVEKVEAPEMDD